jgi:RyR and IP3R Homology associated
MEKGDAQSSQVSLPSEESIVEKSKEKEKRLAPEIAIMQPIFRFLQLLCENHNSELQVGCYFMDYLKLYFSQTMEMWVY